MQSRRSLLDLLIAFTTTCDYAFAELPPLSKDQLDAGATLIVTGIVTDVQVSWATFHEYGREYTCDLTVQVGNVAKGKIEPGKILVARGTYIALRNGYVGGAGHYSGNFSDRLNTIGPGSELTLHLYESNGGTYGIVGPNGFTVLSKVPPPDAWWPWIVGGSVLGAVLIAGICLRRRKRN